MWQVVHTTYVIPVTFHVPGVAVGASKSVSRVDCKKEEEKGG